MLQTFLSLAKHSGVVLALEMQTGARQVKGMRPDQFREQEEPLALKPEAAEKEKLPEPSALEEETVPEPWQEPLHLGSCKARLVDA